MTAIVLATFNGAPWLDAQLGSLFAQTDQDWHLWVSDDGSADGTLEVLHRWRDERRGRLTVLEPGGHRGYRENFRRLLHEVDADAYFLCDQDDVWHPEKVAALRQRLDGAGDHRPALAFCDLEVVDDQLRPLHPSLWALQRTDPEAANDLRRLAVTNVVTGCACAFNRAARDLVGDEGLEPVHDHALALLVVRAGGVLLPVHRALVKYRQHGANSIGARSFLARWPSRMAHLVKGSHHHLARRAVAWGLFPNTAAYYTYKVGLWLRRLVGGR